MARQLIAPPVKGEQRLRMSYEEWLAWATDNHLSEWVDGEVIVSMPPSEVHQDIVGFLYVLLSWYARRFDLGKVRFAPFEMRLSSRLSREPDLLFVAREHADRRTGSRLEGPADLAVEVVSTDSAKRDRQDKFAEYAAAGVPEFWLCDPRPRRRRTDFFRLTEAGIYVAAPLDADGRYHSAVLPGFWLKPEWLWQDPLPDPDALKPLIASADVLGVGAAAGGATGEGGGA